MSDVWTVRSTEFLECGEHKDPGSQGGGSEGNASQLKDKFKGVSAPFEEIGKKMEALGEQMEAASEIKDEAECARLSAEMDKLQVEQD